MTSSGADDLRQLRRRQADSRAALERRGVQRPASTGVYRGQVYDGGALPSTVPAVYLTRPLALAAEETAGAVPTDTADETASVPVLCLGPRVPAAGDAVRARLVGGLWVAPTRAVAATLPRPGCCPGHPLPSRLWVHSPFGVHPVDFSGESDGVALWDGAQFGADVIGFVAFDAATSTVITGPVTVPMRWDVRCIHLVGDTYELSLTAWHGGAFGPFIPVGVGTSSSTFPRDSFEGEAAFPIGRRTNECITCASRRFQFAFQFDFYPDGENLSPSAGDPTILAILTGRLEFPAGTYTAPVVVTDSSTPPTIPSTDVCLTARTCRAPDGVVIPGCAVELKKLDGTSVGTATTDVDGRACLPVTQAGPYRATVTRPDGCSAVVPAFVGICSTADVRVEAILCCGVARPIVRDPDSGDPLEGIAVSAPGHADVLTGADGIASFAVSADEAARLPHSGCTPLLRVTAHSPVVEGIGETHVSTACVDVPVPCDGTSTDPPTPLYLAPLDEDDDDEPDWVYVGPLAGPPARPALCPPGDCTQPDPEDRGYVRRRRSALVWGEIQGESGWESIVQVGSPEGPGPDVGPAGIVSTGGIAVDLELDDDTLNGTGTGPFGPGPAVVYYGERDPSPYPEPPGSGCNSAGQGLYDFTRVWLADGLGAVLQHVGPGATGTTATDTLIRACALGPGGSPPKILEFPIPGDPDLCDEGEGSIEHEQAEPQFRGRVEWI